MVTIMSSDKYMRLVGLLIARTDAKTAPWEPTGRDGVFALSLPDYTVWLARARNRDNNSAWDIVFSILNSDGDVIDSFRDVDAASDLPDSATAYRQMENLYDKARRKALGVDKALDKVIEELGKS